MSKGLKLGIMTDTRTARDHDFDVVLIDTAGRMQDNEVRGALRVRCQLHADSPLPAVDARFGEGLSIPCIGRYISLINSSYQLVATNNPDKILFVGEALVGNEAVDQLQKFDRALRDFSSAGGSSAVGKGRGIDGMVVTKWDTVDDKVRIYQRR